LASVFSHAVVALGIGACFYRPGTPKRVWVIGALCSAIPDLDVIGFRFGVHYSDFWGHRGFTHSLVFAALLATAALAIGFWRKPAGLGRFLLWIYFFLATASHGLLDAMTDGGLGVAFPSTTLATSSPGLRFASHPSASAASLVPAAWKLCVANCSGFGCRQRCYQFRLGSFAVGPLTLPNPECPLFRGPESRNPSPYLSFS